MSPIVDDFFPLSTVGVVREVQMQLGCEQEGMIITSPKETQLGDRKVTRNVWLGCSALEKMKR